MCLYIDDPVEVLSDGYRTARKAHRCYECNRRINPGERYHHQTHVFEGDLSEVKTCAHCDAAIDLGCALTGCPKAYYYGAVFEVLDESFSFIADILEHPLSRVDRFRVLRCVAAARRQWRWSDGTLMDLPPAPVLDEAVGA